MGRLDSPIQLVFVITAQPVDALNAIKGRFHIKDWISDPCYLILWEGIGCHGIGEFDADNRISEIDLSGRKLTGSVPDDIEQLTALLTL
uniref:Uncharacterized protein n=1 Tax=Picea sitchensis TaxID=3332 RepID=A9NJY8_PICSI|nr:unknown [Picea sitchensis]